MSEPTFTLAEIHKILQATTVAAIQYAMLHPDYAKQPWGVGVADAVDGISDALGRLIEEKK